MIPAPLVSGTTRLLAIIGDPVAQVRSPMVYNPRIAAAGVDAILVPIHIPALSFEGVMPSLKLLGNLVGLVVTVPFKERALAFADQVLPVGKQVGAVNALRREPDGRWTADMFDGVGLLRAVAGLGAEVKGASVLLLGAGGAGRAIAISLAQAGAAAMTIFDLDGARAERLAERVTQYYPACSARAGEPVAAGHGILVNATPVGMAPGDGLPAAIGGLDAATAVVDIVPTPAVTPLMRYAAAAGCKVVGGQAMIEGQTDAVLEFFGVGA